VVLVDHAAEELSSLHRGFDVDDRGGVVVGSVLVEALVRPVVVEVALVFGEYGAGVSLVVDQYAVGAFGPDAADEAFGVAVRPRCPRWRADYLHRLSDERRVERCGELRVAITDEEKRQDKPSWRRRWKSSTSKG
jgi:hypothetical protein